MRIYDTQRSGNAWKVRLLAGLLGLELERVTLSIDRGDLRTDAFRDLNPMRQVPVLLLDDGSTLGESLAILFYLAQGSPWWPQGPAEQARVLAWMAFEQERHMKPLAQLRLHLALHRDRTADDADMRRHAAEGREALDILEAQLAWQGPDGWVATAAQPSIADIALYPYTRLAGMGGIDMAGYPRIGAWVARIQALPGYQPLFPGRGGLDFSTAETPATS